MLNTLALLMFGTITLGSVTPTQIEFEENNAVHYVNIQADKVDDSDHPKYFIDQNTTIEELETMQREAIAAGIEFEFYTTYKKGLLKKLDLYFSIKTSTETSSCSHTVSISDYKVKKKGFTVNWILDESGKAIDFYFG